MSAIEMPNSVVSSSQIQQSEKPQETTANLQETPNRALVPFNHLAEQATLTASYCNAQQNSPFIQKLSDDFLWEVGKCLSFKERLHLRELCQYLHLSFLLTGLGISKISQYTIELLEDGAIPLGLWLHYAPKRLKELQEKVANLQENPNTALVCLAEKINRAASFFVVQQKSHFIQNLYDHLLFKVFTFLKPQEVLPLRELCNFLHLFLNQYLFGNRKLSRFFCFSPACSLSRDEHCPYYSLDRLGNARMIVDKNKVTIFQVMPSGLFIRAAQFGHLKVIQEISTNLSDFITNADYRNAFVVAARNGQLKIVQYFDEHYRNVLTEVDYFNAYYSAGENGHVAILQYLQKTRNKLSEIINRDCFIAAAEHNQIAVLQYLGGYCRDQLALAFDSALIRAARKGHIRIVQYLEGHFYDELSSHGCDLALEEATRYGHTEVVKYIGEFFRNNCSTAGYDAALSLAARTNHGEILQYFGTNLRRKFSSEGYRKAFFHSPSQVDFLALVPENYNHCTIL